jgi:hypothetical protein
MVRFWHLSAANHTNFRAVPGPGRAGEGSLVTAGNPRGAGILRGAPGAR